MNSEEDIIQETIDKISDERKTTEEIKVLSCPVCNERLMYMMPSGSTLYCKKCEKYFKNNNGEVGEEITNPHTNKDVLY